ncbi:hypothetical protein BGW38_008002, partial [Lunasporangiospora selenospora]
MNLKRRLKAEWETTKKARKEFWDRLDEQERDEMYCKNLEVSVVEDKLHVAEQHSSRIQRVRDSRRGADEIGSGNQNRKSNKEPKIKHYNSSRPIRASHASTSTTTPASPSPSPSSSSSAPKPHATIPPSIPATDKDCVFDITKAKRLECTKDGIDVGAAFLTLQQEASPIVNNRQKKLTLANFHRFMTQRKERNHPPAMVQLKYNGYKGPPATPAPTAAKKIKSPVKPAISSLRKDDVLRALESEHPR